MNQQYVDTVRLLLAIAPAVFQSPRFALKGGTALNLFLHDMPRLSVDIDVVFTDHMLDRETALRAIAADLKAAKSAISALGYRATLPTTKSGDNVQGVFRDNVRSVERAWCITKIERMAHLIASHVQPWRDSSNDQRLDGENGLLLTPTIDHLFDKGFIFFEDSGQLIVSPVADPKSLTRMGINLEGRVNVGAFSQGQRRYLDFHRENVLRMARGVAGAR